jgi:hypothetical protein
MLYPGPRVPDGSRVDQGRGICNSAMVLLVEIAIYERQVG